jgi:hypothetical protein
MAAVLRRLETMRAYALNVAVGLGGDDLHGRQFDGGLR